MSEYWRTDDLGLEQLGTVLTGRRPVPDSIRFGQLTERLADLGEIWNKLEVVRRRADGSASR